MGETEIIKYLIKVKGRPVTLKELSQQTKVNKTNVARACRNLAHRKRKEIKIRKVRQGPYIRSLIYLNF